MIHLSGTIRMVARVVFALIFFLIAHGEVTAQKKNKRIVQSAAAPKPEIIHWNEKAEFPGGAKALEAYLDTALKYPPAATENGVMGRVVVKFFIDEKGKPVDAKIMRGIGAGCEEAALNVIAQMPQWKPARHDGKPLKSLMILPIKFKQ